MPDAIEKIVEQPSQEVVASDEAYIEAEQSAVEQEKKLEEKEYFLEEQEEGVDQGRGGVTPPLRTNAPTTPAAPWKDQVVLDVERILEQDLADVYQSLPDSAKPLFKKKGEEVADELAKMVRGLNIQLKRALQLICDWLLTIPKVNKFFLEQEAKIKVDQLNALVEDRIRERTKTP